MRTKCCKIFIQLITHIHTLVKAGSQALLGRWLKHSLHSPSHFTLCWMKLNINTLSDSVFGFIHWGVFLKSNERNAYPIKIIPYKIKYIFKFNVLFISIVSYCTVGKLHDFISIVMNNGNLQVHMSL